MKKDDRICFTNEASGTELEASVAPFTHASKLNGFSPSLALFVPFASSGGSLCITGWESVGDVTGDVNGDEKGEKGWALLLPLLLFALVLLVVVVLFGLLWLVTGDTSLLALPPSSLLPLRRAGCPWAVGGSGSKGEDVVSTGRTLTSKVGDVIGGVCCCD